MPYDFQSRLRHAGDRFKDMGESMTLRRDGEADAEVTCFPILMKGEEVIPGVAVTRLEFQDWGIDAADYDFGGGATAPQHGDELERANGDVFRVVSMGSDEPPFQFVDSNRTRLLVHTERTREG